MTADKNKEELIPTEPVIVGNNADGVIIENISKPDDATLALQRQLADLRKSEELQRQHATQMMAARAQPPTREQKLAMWKQQGMSPADEQFLAENPQMIDLHDLTAVAAGEAAEQGHERDGERPPAGDQGKLQPAPCPPAGSASAGSSIRSRACLLCPTAGSVAGTTGAGFICERAGQP